MFWVEKKMLLHQAKIGEHECSQNSKMYKVATKRLIALVLTYFNLTKDNVIFFRSETFIVNFLHRTVLVCKAIMNHFKYVIQMKM